MERGVGQLLFRGKERAKKVGRKEEKGMKDEPRARPP